VKQKNAFEKKSRTNMWPNFGAAVRLVEQLQ
jgi:hypothetical protein